MQVNMKWVIIGIIFMIVMVAFGRDPAEEKAKAKEEAMKGKDALVESIREHNEKKGGGKLGAGMLGDTSSDKPVEPPEAAPVLDPSRRRSDQYPPHLMRTPGQSSRSGYTGPQTPAPAEQPTEPQGYYPPPPQPAGR